MHITEISVFQIDLPLKEGRYAWSNGNYVEIFDTTVVEIKTSNGLCGYGECCPLGPAYLPAYAKGVRGGIEEMAPHLIGLDPTNLHAVNQAMDKALKGHPHVKAPVDVACWDLLGKATSIPVHALLGGAALEYIPLYRAISQEAPDAMAAKVKNYASEGYRKFQLKVGGDPDEDIERIHACRAVLEKHHRLIADANTGWSQHEAQRVTNACRSLDVYIEQPCPSYQECRSIRQRTNLPFILDETIVDLAALTRALSDQAMDMVNIKISKIGGLTRAKLLRDLCAAHGIAMIIEDSWGGDIATAAIAHLARSTPEKFLFAATDFNSYGTVTIADDAPQRKNGFMTTPDTPGLGFKPRLEALGAPVLVFD